MYDLVLPFLNRYPREVLTEIHEGAFTRLFIAWQCYVWWSVIRSNLGIYHQGMDKKQQMLTVGYYVARLNRVDV